VLSELTKPRPLLAVVKWLREHEHEAASSAIVLDELEYGILLRPSGSRRRRLEPWFAGTTRHFEVLASARETASVWARLLSELERAGRRMSVKDSLVPATARQYNLTVATRNIGDFERAGVRVLNPFSP